MTIRYMRKPIEVKAFRLASGEVGEAPQWVLDAMAREVDTLGSLQHDEIGRWVAVSNSGPQVVSEGDWLVLGPDGVEIYPVKPAAFEQLYDIVDDDEFKTTVTIVRDGDDVKTTIVLQAPNDPEQKATAMWNAMQGLREAEYKLLTDVLKETTTVGALTALGTLRGELEAAPNDSAVDVLDKYVSYLKTVD